MNNDSNIPPAGGPFLWFPAIEGGRASGSPYFHGVPVGLTRAAGLGSAECCGVYGHAHRGVGARIAGGEASVGAHRGGPGNNLGELGGGCGVGLWAQSMGKGNWNAGNIVS